MSWVFVKRSTVAALAATALAGCASNYASAPVTLSDAVKQEYASWQRSSPPSFFAVTRDGQVSGNVTCIYGTNCSLSKASEVLSRCEVNAAAKRNTSGCVVYAIDGKPLVDDPALKAYIATAPALEPAPAPARRSAPALSTVQCVRNGQVVAMQDRVVEHSITASASGQIVLTGKDADGQPFTIVAGAGDTCQAKPVG